MKRVEDYATEDRGNKPLSSSIRTTTETILLLLFALLGRRTESLSSPRGPPKSPRTRRLLSATARQRRTEARDLKEKRLTSCFAWQYLDLVIGYRPALAAAAAD